MQKYIELEPVGDGQFRMTELDNPNPQKKRKPLLLVAKILTALLMTASLALVGYGMAEGQSLVPFQSEMQQAIDQTNADILKVSLAAVALSQMSSALIGERAAPIMEELDEITDYLLTVSIALMAQKVVLALSGILLFIIFVPFAGAFFLLNKKAFAAKIIATGFIIYALIPVSFGLSKVLDNSLTYETTTIVTTSQTEAVLQSEQAGGILGWFKNKVSEIGDKISELATEQIAKAEAKLEELTNKVLRYLTVNILMPLLTTATAYVSIKLIWKMKEPLPGIHRLRRRVTI